ncbi:MAG: VOC family protein, partial [Steroidobacteraceae bacterium]
QDTPLTDHKRWIVVRPRSSVGCGLLLAAAATERQLQAIGCQSGWRVFLFLYTDNFERDYIAFLRQGVRFVEQPRQEPCGMVAVFTDFYGNRWDLIERSSASTART